MISSTNIKKCVYCYDAQNMRKIIAVNGKSAKNLGLLDFLSFN